MSRPQDSQTRRRYRPRVRLSLEAMKSSLRLSCAAAAAGAAAVPAMGLTRNTNALAYGFAALFWLSLVVQALSTGRAAKARERLEHYGYRFSELKNAPIGLLAFCRNPKAKIADCALALSLGLLALSFRFWPDGMVTFFLTAALFAAFSLHCVFNGRNFRYLCAYEINQKEQEKHE